MADFGRTRKAFEQLFTFTRDREVHYFDSQNNIKKAVVNEPAFPVNGIALQSEQNLSPILSNRGYFDNVWVKIGTNTTSPTDTGFDGTTPLPVTISDANTDAAGGFYQDFTNDSPSDTEDGILSVFIKKLGSGTHYPSIGYDMTGGTTPNSDQIIIDAVNGTWVRESTSTGTGAVTITEYGDWWRVSLVVTNNGSGNTSIRATLLAAFNSDGTGTVDNTVTGETIMDFPSYYARTTTIFDPLEIPLAAESEFRDELSLDNSDGWFNADEFTFYGEFKNIQLRTTDSDAIPRRQLLFYKDSADNEIQIRQDQNGDLEVVASISSNQAGFYVIPYVKDLKFAFSLQGGGSGPFLLAYNGVGVDATGTTPLTGLLGDGTLTFNAYGTNERPVRYFEVKTFDALVRAAELPELIELTQ